MTLLPQLPYSYRKDPAVPSFPDDGPVLVVDGACTLCSVWARFVARHDRDGAFRLAVAQTPLGRALLRHYGLDPEEPESWLCLLEGRAYEGLDGIAVVTRRLGGWPAAVGRLAMVPPPRMRRWIYARVARNRYRIFGRTDLCACPDPALRARLLG